MLQADYSEGTITTKKIKIQLWCMKQEEKHKEKEKTQLLKQSKAHVQGSVKVA